MDGYVSITDVNPQCGKDFYIPSKVVKLSVPYNSLCTTIIPLMALYVFDPTVQINPARSQLRNVWYRLDA